METSSPTYPRAAMILAAGKGTRMHPLTLTTPKPLLLAAGKPLIEWHIENLVRAGFKTLVINHFWLGEQLEHAIGDGSRWGITIHWSAESELLETGGGIRKALAFLGKEPFLVVNGDIFTNMNFASLRMGSDKLAHLVMVPNPVHNRKGDFVLNQDVLHNMSSHNVFPQNSTEEECLTFSGISILHPRLFDHQPDVAFPLAPLLQEAVNRGEVSGELYTDYWLDVGTPERLQALEQHLLKELGNPSPSA